MPQRKLRVPKYRLNKTSGRALVEINGVTHWLGKHDTPESREKYDRLIAEWLAGGRGVTVPAVPDLMVVELIDRFWSHVEAFYRRRDGSRTAEVDNFRIVLRPVKALYGSTPAAAFGPKALRAVRQRMIEMGWCRSSINKQVSRVRQMFKWAASQELIPPGVHLALATVPGLRRGKSEAREAEPVRPVPDADVDAIRPHVARQVWAMVEIQRLTGMRPGEAVAMRTCDVDRSGKVWAYRPTDHKTAHHGHDRIIFIGPKAQAELSKWLRPDLAAYLFQPAEAEADRRRSMHEARKQGGTPLSQGNRPGTNRRRRPKWKPGDRYDVAAYRRAIERGCERAFGMPEELRKLPKRPAGETVKPADLEAWSEEVKRIRAAAAEWRRLHTWHPHQLRHNAATFLRKEYGLEAAQVILGHRTLSVTEIYAAKNVEAARRIMGEVG